MATGKYISLEEARKDKKLDRFVKAHPSSGNEDVFDELLLKMSPPVKDSKNRKSDHSK